MQQYHVISATNADETVVQAIFTNAAERFKLVDTFLASRVQKTLCNYSEGLGWGFGLRAIRVDGIVCVGLNPCKATPERYRPVFDLIIGELTKAFGDRVGLVAREKHLETFPPKPMTEEMRAFTRRLLERGRSDGKVPIK